MIRCNQDCACPGEDIFIVWMLMETVRMIWSVFYTEDASYGEKI